MKKSLLARLATLFLTTSTLAGCIFVPVDDGYRQGYPHERDRGEHRGERYEGSGDHR